MANAIKHLTLDDRIEFDAETINKAKKNDGAAYYDIGYGYGIELKNYSKAMAWYQLAANQNNPFAQNSIGVLYDNGFGVSQDYYIAMDYYLKAAGNNDNVAKENMGEHFYMDREYKSINTKHWSGISKVGTNLNK